MGREKYNEMRKQLDEELLAATCEYAASAGLIVPELPSIAWHIDGATIKDGERVFLHVYTPPGGEYVFTPPSAEQIA